MNRLEINQSRLEQESRDPEKNISRAEGAGNEIIGNKELIDHLIHLDMQNLVFRNCGSKEVEKDEKEVAEGEEEEEVKE